MRRGTSASGTLGFDRSAASPGATRGTGRDRSLWEITGLLFGWFEPRGSGREARGGWLFGRSGEPAKAMIRKNTASDTSRVLADERWLNSRSLTSPLTLLSSPVMDRDVPPSTNISPSAGFLPSYAPPHGLAGQLIDRAIGGGMGAGCTWYDTKVRDQEGFSFLSAGGRLFADLDSLSALLAESTAGART